MAQARAECVDVEQLRELLEGASEEQVQAAASALEKVLMEQEKNKASIEKQTVSVQYTCDGTKQLSLQVEASSGGRHPHKFQGQGRGRSEGSGKSVETITPRIPANVYKETRRFCVRAVSEEGGQLVFLNDSFCPLGAVCLPFKSAPALGCGLWN